MLLHALSCSFMLFRGHSCIFMNFEAFLANSMDLKRKNIQLNMNEHEYRGKGLKTFELDGMIWMDY